MVDETGPSEQENKQKPKPSKIKVIYQKICPYKDVSVFSFINLVFPIIPLLWQTWAHISQKSWSSNRKNLILICCLRTIPKNEQARAKDVLKRATEKRYYRRIHHTHHTMPILVWNECLFVWVFALIVTIAGYQSCR